MASGGDSAAAGAPDGAVELARGVARLLADRGYATLAEFRLRTGRRADVAGLDRKGHVVIVEIKRTVADLRSDAKWPDYLDYCDAFYFAVPQGFDRSLLPDDCGLMIADRFAAQVVREARIPASPLHASRRREVTLRFARAAAKRLRQLTDPGV